MEFAIKTLVVFALVLIATIVIILFIQVWSGNSVNVVDAAYDFLNSIIGIKR